MTAFLDRPDARDFAPYYQRYLDQVPAGDLLDLLESQWEALGGLLENLDDVAADHRYAPGKWCVKEVLGHILDAERIFGYRLLSVARGEQADLPGFDEDPYVAAAEFGSRSLGSLLDEFDLVRGHTLALLRGLPESALAWRGRVRGNPVTVPFLACLVHGHAQHHLQVLRERYL
jgi:hypothetical protein